MIKFALGLQRFGCAVPDILLLQSANYEVSRKHYCIIKTQTQPLGNSDRSPAVNTRSPKVKEKVSSVK